MKDRRTVNRDEDRVPFRSVIRTSTLRSIPELVGRTDHSFEPQLCDVDGCFEWGAWIGIPNWTGEKVVKTANALLDDDFDWHIRCAHHMAGVVPE